MRWQPGHGSFFIRHSAFGIRHSAGARSAFTLMELLTVIAIIALIAGLVFPMIGAMSRSGRVEAGMNMLAGALANARAHARRQPALLTNVGSVVPTIAQGGVTYERFTVTSPVGFSGTAILITPGGEIRFLEHDDSAVDGAGDFLAMNPENVADPGDPPNMKYLKAFKDIQGMEAVQLPAGVGIAGISRGGTGTGSLEILPPPFVIRFDKYGRIIHGSRGTYPDRVVFYDGNQNEEVTTTYYRTHTPCDQYDPDEYDPDCPQYNEQKTWWNPTSQYPDKDNRKPKAIVPLENIDTVIGVVLFDKNAFWGEFREGWPNYGNVKSAKDAIAAYDPGDPDGIDQVKWVLDHGTFVFFNRYTGTILEK
ncbi:MAG: prepilin-type N-terminal cleavage/methylation domain-containing protein [Phycisphaeraceae bacterium]|nr:prepilin-type N-terminal cleavage/methylation domain-containing protein [Phycisphaeraceae bacterium]